MPTMQECAKFKFKKQEVKEKWRKSIVKNKNLREIRVRTVTMHHVLVKVGHSRTNK